ncbi:hypothetical protein ED312_14960 [Sinomicrobium pectinilyticum]|uniref:Oligosaccharide repeat unit polymerase n=1 Tax=Sinomicrobium pectinilyticum TaxID=1084421 RepID=A0A3N0E6S9_SINP1|nr:hypothetical protein [Sinomicrobium pectinilyticum]RNL83544.1 hypothetical protein ED312_14960 [Sinomicrobium pectinilyticum]
MALIVSFIFLVECFLIAFFLFDNLWNKGITFKGGISFGVLYFVFIPVLVLISTGSIPVSQIDFSQTHLSDVSLTKDIKASFILIAYLFSIVLYLYSDYIIPRKKVEIKEYNPRLKIFFTIYLATLLVIFFGSGLLQGGNWYYNRHQFFEKSGSFAVFIAFILNASKILIIGALIHSWIIDKMPFNRFLFGLMVFTIFDMVISGNRIYLFITLVIVSLLLLKKYPVKVLKVTPVLAPFIFLLGYLASVFRHARGEIFIHGLPTPQFIYINLLNAINIEPLNFTKFFLDISESVNVNVIYDIFNRYDNILYGKTYLKTFFFYVPRSIWPSKPESITIMAADAFGSTSLVTTMIGEMHMNFSYLGILFILLLLYITEYLTQKLIKPSFFSSVIAFFIGVLIFRMPYSDELIVFFIVTGIIYLSSQRVKIVCKR